MPKSIKPSMSKDMLDPFDYDIEEINYQDGCIEVVIKKETFSDTLLFDEKDLETMLEFLRRFKNENK